MPTIKYLRINKTIKLLTYSYYWDSLPYDIKKYINLYIIYQHIKARRHLSRGRHDAGNSGCSWPKTSLTTKLRGKRTGTIYTMNGTIKYP